MEGDAPTGMSEAPGNSATAAPTGPAAAPATPRPQSALHLGDARRSILEIRESSDGRSSGSFVSPAIAAHVHLTLAHFDHPPTPKFTTILRPCFYSGTRL
jgi:hypothetical protein